MCLANKDPFIAGTLELLEDAAINTLDIAEDKTVMLEIDQEESIEMMAKDSVIYLEKAAVLKMSGLEDVEGQLHLDQACRLTCELSGAARRP